MDMRILLLMVLGAGPVFAVAPPQEKQPPAPAAKSVVIQVAKQAEKKPVRSLQWSLLIDPLDEVPGNAAPLWIKAGSWPRTERHQWTKEQKRWHLLSEQGALPVKEVKELLSKYTYYLKIADLAAYRNRCEWDFPAMTVEGSGFPWSSEILGLYEIAKLISFRCHVHLSEKNFHAARKDLQIGFRLAYQVGQSDLFLQQLVGLAITHTFLIRVEDWIQQAGSPNLYWALTELPRPWIDLTRSVRSELEIINRYYPHLKNLKKATLSRVEAARLEEQFLSAMRDLSSGLSPEWKKKLESKKALLEYLPVAKKELVSQGRSQQQVDSMTPMQIVATFFLGEFDRVRDEYVCCSLLPPWMAHQEMAGIHQRLEPREKAWGLFPFAASFLGIQQSFGNQVFCEQFIDKLRIVEAIRLYLGEHGKLPVKLGDITEVPLPINPFTGKSFEDAYTVKNGVGILTLPHPARFQHLPARRYTFVVGK